MVYCCFYCCMVFQGPHPMGHENIARSRNKFCHAQRMMSALCHEEQVIDTSLTGISAPISGDLGLVTRMIDQFLASFRKLIDLLIELLSQ